MTKIPYRAKRAPPQAPATPHRRDWRSQFGPLDLRMPNDGPGVLLSGPFPQAHEDSQDCLNADGSWGPADFGAPGGTGIAFGYAWDDLPSVRTAAAAVKLRTPIQPPGYGINGYDWAHSVRGFRYQGALAEMTGAPEDIAGLIDLAKVAVASFPIDGPIYDGPGWIPFNLNQYHHMALLNPGHGLWWDRAMGWMCYLVAWAMKYDRRVGVQWANMMLDTFDICADPNTGQTCDDVLAGIDQIHTQYTFHWAIQAHGVMALCYRLGRPCPAWVLNGMHALKTQQPIDYYGSPSIPSYMYSQGGVLTPATGPAQHGDPAFGWWSNNCVAVNKLTGDPRWITDAALWGPTLNLDEQSRKETMLIRGHQI